MSNELMKLDEVLTIAEAFAKSGYFDNVEDQSQAIVKILAGRELGLGPMAGMSGINIIKGKVSLSGNLLASLVKRHPEYDYKILKHDNEGCKIAFFENGLEIDTSEFTIEDAERAGLLGGKMDLYKKYPKNLFFNRAMSNGVKWFFPHLTNGPAVYVEGELEDTPVVVQEDSFIIERDPDPDPAPPIPENTPHNAQEEIKKLVLSMKGSPSEKVEAVNVKIAAGNIEREEYVTVKDVNLIVARG